MIEACDGSFMVGVCKCMITSGQRVRFRQVSHLVSMGKQDVLRLHSNPKIGTGLVVATAIITGCDEQRLWVLPDSDRRVEGAETILLRLPPDEAEVI